MSLVPSSVRASRRNQFVRRRPCRSDSAIEAHQPRPQDSNFKRSVLNAGQQDTWRESLRLLRPSLDLLTTYQPCVKSHMPSKLSICVLLSFAAMLSACGTPAAKDFGGRWKPVNRYDEKAVEIPLALPYTYYAAPMDGTLKAMLTRWTSDTGIKLVYKLRSDFTLPKSTSTIHTTEVRDAASQLSAIYAPQGVAVVVDGPVLVVEETSAATAPLAASGSQPKTSDAANPATN
ncbi:hypothetical protein [Luteibacter sp. Lutesp34]|uniref:hypothetical protein n=1 Tax=Luteibacter sp. Lutesp34 TaxID=3243030 RepID=UPI0039B49B28